MDLMGRAHRGMRTRFLFVGSAVLFGAFSACSGAPQSNGAQAGIGGTASSSASTSSSSSTSGVGGAGGSPLMLTASGSSSGGGDGGCMMGSIDCMTNAQCDDGDPSTVDTCIISGGEVPVGTCVHVACDGGVSCSVDTTCSEADAGTVYPPFVPLYPPDVPSTCANGFEVCDAEGAPTYTIKAVPPGGSRQLTLDLDFATYVAPDGLLITGLDSCGQQYVLFDSCRLQTADQSEGSYTNGMARPTDPAIRQFHLALREGTGQLTFDFSRVVSPMYFQILGLCDFSLPPAPGVGWFNLVP
jgi:hypothetical protein